MVKKELLYDYYFEQQIKYEKKYGKDKTVVFMQVGSFHEAYNYGNIGYDLVELSKILNFRIGIKSKKEKASISNPYILGFPDVAFSKNLKLLIDNGYTIIIIDQVTPPPRPRREVTGVYSQGTYIEEEFSSDSNNIICLYIENEIQKNGNTLMCIGMSVVDLSTGESCVHEVFAKYGDEKYSLDEATRFIHSYSPKEIIIFMKPSNEKSVMKKESIILYLEIESKNYRFYESIDKNYFRIQWQDELLSKIYKDTGMLSPVEYIDMEKYHYATISFVALMDFAFQHNENIINNLDKPEIFQNSRHLILGNNTVFQLNVLETDNFEGFNKRFKSLFNVVDNTSTAIGKRFLKNTLVSPLINPQELNLRYNCIEDMLIEGKKYIKVEEYLKGILDLERLARKLSLFRINPFELVNLYESYCESLKLFKFLDNKKFIKRILPKKNVIKNLEKFLEECDKLFDIEEMKKHSLSNIENNFFKKGIDKDIDKIQGEIYESLFLLDNICSILSNYIDDTCKAKFIKKEDSKIYLKYNDRDGYYLSLTKLRAKSLKKNLEKKKKIEITENYELHYKDLDFKDLAKGNTKIFSKDLTKRSDNITVLKNKLTSMVKRKYINQLEIFDKKYRDYFKYISKSIGYIDFIKSNAKTANIYHYCKPNIVLNKGKQLEKGFIRCNQLRHPIIERVRSEYEYIPHDIAIGKYESNNDNNDNDNNDNDIPEGMLLYGLNSSGKSSLMKALGLSVIMAQSGMYVPAEEYNYSPYETLFSRITGNDNLFKGLSSFALEMTELRAILKRTGPKTLVIGDEVCRGTEHISGTAIVSATIIKLSKTGSTFIFATHLHDLVKMKKIKELDNVKSFHLTVDFDKENDTLVFDRILKSGSGPPVYGITVAKYLIHDNDFIKLAQEIKNDLLKMPNQLVDTKKSKYNSEVYMYECGICNKKFKSDIDHFGLFDTHHINFQKDCEDGFIKSKPHIPMNSKANLIVLCKECHHKVHHNELIIKGYIETSNGRKVDYKENNELIEVTSDSNESSDSEYIKVSPKKKQNKKKYKNDEIARVLELKNKKSQKNAKKILKDKYNMNVSIRTIKKIWDNNY